ncbi:MAG: TPR end-of-group domain-containing protein [Planctomycetota bacterium]
MSTRIVFLSLIVALLLGPARTLVAGESSLKDRIYEDVKTRRIHSTEGETPEADRPIIKGDDALDPVTREPLEVVILKAEKVAGALKYAAFYSPNRKVYWAFVWGGPRRVRIIHGPFELSTVTQAAVERVLQKLITPEGNYGFYKDQFKELVKMGKGVVPHLLKIFRDESQDIPMRVLSIEALGDIKDESVIPKLREFLGVEDYRRYQNSIIFTLAKLGDMHFANRLIESIRDAMDRAPDNPAVQAQGWGQLAHAYARLENQDKAIECYRNAIKADPENAGSHYYNMACAFSVMKRIDEAIEALEKAVENNYDDYDWMQMDGDLKNLRKDPRFKALLKKLKER